MHVFIISWPSLSLFSHALPNFTTQYVARDETFLSLHKLAIGFRFKKKTWLFGHFDSLPDMFLTGEHARFIV